MDKLSREELERMKKRAENVYAIMGDQNTKKHILIFDTALALYQEVEELENELLTAHDDGVMSGMEAMQKENEAIKARVREVRKEYKHKLKYAKKNLQKAIDENNLAQQVLYRNNSEWCKRIICDLPVILGEGKPAEGKEENG